MELKDTIKLMQSSDYKDRFKAEYYQLEIRYYKLRNVIHKYEFGELDFELSCPIEMLKEQSDFMERYLRILELRAEIEGISLDN